MYQGFIDEADGGTLIFQIRTATGAPVEPDSAPKFKIVGPSGLISGASSNGSASSLESGSVTGASNASPIVITAPGHSVVVGQSVKIAGVGGNTNANGTFIVSAKDASTFTLTGSAGNAAYTSGGTWRTTGLYKVTISSTQGLTPGQTYTCILTWLESGVQRTMQCTFTVR